MFVARYTLPHTRSFLGSRVRPRCSSRLFACLIALNSQVTARTEYLPNLEATVVPSFSNSWKAAYVQEPLVSSSGYALQILPRGGLVVVDGDSATKAECVLKIVVNTNAHAPDYYVQPLNNNNELITCNDNL